MILSGDWADWWRVKEIHLQRCLSISYATLWTLASGWVNSFSDPCSFCSVNRQKRFKRKSRMTQWNCFKMPCEICALYCKEMWFIVYSFKQTVKGHHWLRNIVWLHCLFIMELKAIIICTYQTNVSSFAKVIAVISVANASWSSLKKRVIFKQALLQGQGCYY